MQTETTPAAPQPTRQRILDATAELFRRYGYTGTGLKQIVADANAPFGSIYHFFPGGKQELGREVILRSGRMYQELVEAVWADGAAQAGSDVVAGVAAVFSGAAAVLDATDYADACPIATVALEVASTNETLRRATADVFESWIGAAATWLVEAGVAPSGGRDLAIVVIQLLEGGFLLSRAAKTTEAMEAAGAAACSLVAAAIGTPATRRRANGPRRK